MLCMVVRGCNLCFGRKSALQVASLELVYYLQMTYLDRTHRCQPLFSHIKERNKEKNCSASGEKQQHCGLQTPATGTG